MPNYGTPVAGSVPTSLKAGDSAYFWNAESPEPSVPVASLEVCIPVQEGGPAPAVSIELVFGGAPGAFSFQLQEADTDTANDFITPSAAAYTITSVNSNNVARSDLIPTAGRFLRGYLSSLANNVTVTAKITRIA